MRRLTAAMMLAFILAAAGCNQYCVDVSLEGINYFVQHPTCTCCHCPYASPDCPYYDYEHCEWANVREQPTISAMNSAAIAPKPGDK